MDLQSLATRPETTAPSPDRESGARGAGGVGYASPHFRNIRSSASIQPPMQHPLCSDARADDAHLQRIDAPRRPRCVIVGAGITGLMAAYVLRMQGTHVTILDKATSPGGRLATRRTNVGTFDHGAQFMTLRDPRLQHYAEAWKQAGVVLPWFGETWRGASGMSSLSRHLAQTANVLCSTQITRIEREGEHWLLATSEGTSWEADTVILTAPVPQSLAMLDAGSVVLPSALRTTLEGITYERCLAGLFEGRWPSSLPAHGVARVEGTLFSWLASNRVKGISERDTLTAHATAAWSLENWDTPDDAVLRSMGENLAAIVGSDAGLVSVALKRWRYARPVSCLPFPSVHRDGAATLIFAGDAFDEHGGRVEGAALSGLAAAGMALSNVNG
jgi:renalase